MIGALEERIVWFEESYRQIMLAGQEAQANAAVQRAVAREP
jgi:hypothetical protein